MEISLCAGLLLVRKLRIKGSNGGVGNAVFIQILEHVNINIAHFLSGASYKVTDLLFVAAPDIVLVSGQVLASAVGQIHDEGLLVGGTFLDLLAGFGEHLPGGAYEGYIADGYGGHFQIHLALASGIGFLTHVHTLQGVATVDKTAGGGDGLRGGAAAILNILKGLGSLGVLLRVLADVALIGDRPDLYCAGVRLFRALPFFQGVFQVCGYVSQRVPPLSKA